MKEDLSFIGYIKMVALDYIGLVVALSGFAWFFFESDYESILGLSGVYAFIVKGLITVGLILIGGGLMRLNAWLHRN